jgi:outer membrane protein insertion porin family
MRRKAREQSGLALALLLAAGLVAPAGARGDRYTGRPVTIIAVEGLDLLSQETLLFYLDLRLGEPLDEAGLDARIKELWSRRLLDDLAVDAEPDGAGVRLSIRVRERPRLRSVEYVGLQRLSRTDVDDRRARERIELPEGEPLDRGELARLGALLTTLYQEKGYRFAHVELALEEAGRGEVRATLTVDEGDKVRIGDIDFEGNEVFGDLRLRWVMKKTKESGLVTRALKKDVYNPANLTEDLVKVRDLYRSAGYKNALLGEPRVEVARDGGRRRLAIIVPIDEGERWRFGDVRIEGNLKFPETALLGLFTLRSGTWLRSDAIDEAVEKVKQAYDNSGYVFSRVEPELVEKEGYVADLVVKIDEGDQFKVGRIEFEGNTSTRDKVLRRELRVQEGLTVNLGGMKNSVYKVNQLGFFKLDEADPVRFDADTAKQTVDLTFKGEEDNRTELQFGAGYSDFQGLFGQLAFRTYNFLGRGETLGVSAELGTQQETFDVAYQVPWFLDRPQSLGFQAFRSDLKFDYAGDSFQRSSLGGAVTYGRSYGLFQGVSLTYQLSLNDDVLIGVDADGDTLTTELEVNTSLIRPGWTYNSIDNRFEPTRGQRIRASLDYAGGVLAGNNYFVRGTAGYTRFLPFTTYPLRTVWGLNAEAGWIEPFGSTVDAAGRRVDRTVSPLDLYFLGGENSVRGHASRSLFVRDAAGRLVTDPVYGTGLGGNKFFQVNLELHALLGGPFRLIGFLDGGNVFGDYEVEVLDGDGDPVFDADGNRVTERVRQYVDLSRLRWTAGVELRLLLPIFGAPLRFIYAVNLQEKPGDEFDTFRFSIGTAF